MMAFPRSATRALGRWPWKNNEPEGKHKEAKTGFDVPMNTQEELKESQPTENEVTAPIVRSPSKLVKKRAQSKDEKDANSVEDAEIPPESRPETPPVDPAAVEHTVSKPNVLVKKNSLSKRAAAAKAVLAETAENDVMAASSDLCEQRPVDTPEPPSQVDLPIVPNGRATPVEATIPDTPAAPLQAPERTPSPLSQVLPFPVRGPTSPNGTRFFEGTDGSLEPTETRTTGITEPVTRPARPQRRISLRSFGFFYGKDSRPSHVFPAYVPPTQRVVHEVGEEAEESATTSHRSAPAHKRRNSLNPIGLLNSRKPTTPKVDKSDRRAAESAHSLRTLIIGPAALDARGGREGKKSETKSSPALHKVNQQLLLPTQANRVIATLRELPPPDLPPAAAETVETVRKKKGWGFGRGNSREQDKMETIREGTGTVAMPIHGCCLDITDVEAEEKHFSKLTGSAGAPGSTGGTETSANAGSADLSSLIPMLKNLRLVNLQASPDLSSVNAASLTAQLTAPDLGFGQAADKDGLLAGSVPSAGSLVDGMEKIGQTLMSLGFATTATILPSHVGVYPPQDRMSALTYWWGYEVVFPPPTMKYLDQVTSISSAVLNFLTAFALFSNGVREMLPFIRYIAQFIDFEWKAIKAQDKGRGVVCAATWVMPAALAPRPWDFVDPPMKDGVAHSMISGPVPTTSAAPAGLAPHVSNPGLTEPIAEVGETSTDKVSDAEVRDEEPSSVRENEQQDEQKGAGAITSQAPNDTRDD